MLQAFNNFEEQHTGLLLYLTINPLTKHQFSSWPTTLSLLYLKVWTHQKCGLLKKVFWNHWHFAKTTLDQGKCITVYSHNICKHCQNYHNHR